MGLVRRGFEVPGSARLELVSGVLLLHPEDAVLDGMLDGWEKQQLGRRLEPDTIRDRQSVVRRFVDFSGEYPWNWTAGHMDEWLYGQPVSRIARLTTDKILSGAEGVQLQLGYRPVEIPEPLGSLLLELADSRRTFAVLGQNE
ncbi:hypothetical protein HUT18_02155 [Streptomyces sp. NA04227]|uniref:hypothetical protein n=1 Tax=Streptomyces sp. NA04227 TaxID=2742136 RepID=UPI001592808D|nr:hypothetical protein [Streptomyces sp. NA04227]QKW05355.1 hypothetical protein HUT18_02155 [Streptomyces sp. NA04227]